MTRRPAGVTVSAILLGFAAALLLLFTATTLLGAVMMGHLPANATATPGVAQPAPAIMAAMTAIMALIYLALAGWAIATLVGLLRMKPWSRISIMIIGGGIAAFGAMSALVCLVMPKLMATMPMPPNANPAMLRGVFVGFAIMSLLVAAIGIYWLVYFALRSTREAFKPQLAPQPTLPYVPAPYVPAPLPHAHSLDFSAAQPMEAPPPQPPIIYADPIPVAYVPTPLPLPTKSGRPVSITILAILFLIGALFALPSVLFLRFPTLILGIMITGPAARIVMLTFMLWTTLSGIGLLARQKPAWYMAMAYCAFGIINTGIMLFPAERLRMSQYMQTISNTVSLGMPQPAFDPFAPPLFHLIILPAMLIGAALVIFMMILLWRARWFFGIGTSTSHDELG